MKLNEIKDNKGARKSLMRVGRGQGCTKGKTCGRGVKGQKSRTGVALKGFEGGQMPIYRRIPKRGFNNEMFALKFEVINVGKLQTAVEEGKLDAKSVIDAEVLQKAGLVGKVVDGVRILGTGTLKEKLNLKVHSASKTAIAAIEKAGGKLEVVAKKTVEEKSSKVKKEKKSK